jgi:DNA-binding NarL/FixJ family response regulator
MSAVSVLVVDDFEPFRQFVISTLDAMPELHVIGAPSDGFDAVQKAEELQPEVIVLDIGLPRQSGIAAGRQIRRVAPESKIIFMTQESSADVVREALSLGHWVTY